MKPNYFFYELSDLVNEWYNNDHVLFDIDLNAVVLQKDISPSFSGSSMYFINFKCTNYIVCNKKDGN